MAGTRALVARVRLVGALVHRNRLAVRRAWQLEREITGTPVWRRARRVADELRRTYRSSDPADALKYLDLDRWLRTALRRAARLELIDRPPRQVADLGAGTGLFLHVCRHFGHGIIGVDLPLDDMPIPARMVYQRLTEVLEVPVERMRLAAHTPPVLPHRVDLITAFMITFNAHRRPDEWGVAEWTQFVTALAGTLHPGGQIHLELNPHPERFGARRFYDAETEAWLARVGRIRQPGIVTIPRPATAG